MLAIIAEAILLVIMAVMVLFGFIALAIGIVDTLSSWRAFAISLVCIAIAVCCHWGASELESRFVENSTVISEMEVQDECYCNCSHHS